MINPNLLYQIGFTLIKGIGNITGRQLVDTLGDVSLVFTEKKSLLERIPGLNRRIIAGIQDAGLLQRAEKEVAFIEKNKIQTYFISDAHYPFRLKECADAPLLFYMRGNANLDAAKCISIVGTRSATNYGKEMTNQLISGVSEAFPDALIVSGVAYGIDIAAHKAALKENLPTVGVLAHGLDRIYPPKHRNAAAQMVKNGGLLTEYMSETTPDRQNFVKRNRIIAGLSDCTVVVESADKGGALITCNIAVSYNRDVLAYPGKRTDKYSQGCNALIKYRKAALIERPEDLFREMNWLTSGPKHIVQKELFQEFTEEEQCIVEVLSKADMQLNSLCIELDFTISKLAPILFELEMKGVITCLPGGIYRLN